ncbi:L-threonylcarbamoyladenylate synthase [Jiulongibacter sediminis]|uniref:Translation factor Sua5 n=1 Tax=Jiulongibacter sediminis TaxID=1605367 RepID=A0A0P7C7B4_9BACT|nr:L-threonylcarbamoyladenylate synthase [Jiulongibacter sediminis]KPM49387.1 translation factor Sua5 [Jiulongibacter sediminis]TBX26436.1 translation factor Sua5 [Jiulongibacter sediminis]
MAAEVLRIYESDPDPSKIDQIVRLLKDGGIIIYPTDTVYAMGCDIYQNRAVEKLSQLKGMKAQKNNFSIVCSDLSDIADYARVSDKAFKVMKKAFPGPFTFILPATNKLPKLLQSNRKNIGIRVPDHPIPQAIVNALGNPIITTSVKDDVDDILEYPNDIEIIIDQNTHKADLIIDGGWSGITPSTVVSFLDDYPEVVREGLGDLDDL